MKLTDGTGTTNFQYDPLGRINQAQGPSTGMVQYGYDANGNRTILTYPDATQLGYAYDGNGRLQTVTRSNGTTLGYSYDGANRLTDRKTTLTSGGATLSDFGYQLDKLGRVTQATETTQVPGSIGGTAASAPSSVNLTTEGTADWARWGQNATTFDHKAAGNTQNGHARPGFFMHYSGYWRHPVE